MLLRRSRPSVSAFAHARADMSSTGAAAASSAAAAQEALRTPRLWLTWTAPSPSTRAWTSSRTFAELAQRGALTNQAMGGSTPFEVALAERLDLVRPDLDKVEAFLAAHPPRLTDGVVDLIAQLHSLDKQVYLVSGGFRQLIYPVADLVGVDHKHVFANNLLFDEDGTYAGFDDKELTAWSGGKSRVMQHLQGVHGDPLVMVGDGATDVEARPPATAVIGFGKNVVRESVLRDADWFVYDFKEMMEVL